MSKEQTSSVAFRVPDFIDADGIEYTDIEVIVEMDEDIRSTANLAETLQPMNVLHAHLDPWTTHGGSSTKWENDTYGFPS